MRELQSGFPFKENFVNHPTNPDKCHVQQRGRSDWRRGGGAAGQWSQQETNVAGTWQTIGQPSDNLFLVSCTDISRRGPRRILGLLPPPPTAGTATCSFQFLL